MGLRRCFGGADLWYLPVRRKERAALPLRAVARGTLIMLRSVLLTSGATTHADPPGPGDGYWYLVRDRSDCGTRTYGQQSDTIECIIFICP
jgi:hypothetical protein